MEKLAKKVDWILIFSILCLIIIGGVLVYSATINEPGEYWQKQVVFYGLGLLCVFFLYIIPAKFFYIAAYPLYFMSLFPLFYISFFKSGSVERWIQISDGFHLQPSEFSKITLVLALSRYLSLKVISLSNIRSLIAPLMIFLVPFILVLKQPDLSTALVFGAVLMALLYWAGMKAWELFILISPILSIILTFQEVLWAILIVSLFLILWTNRVKLILFISVLFTNLAAGYCAFLLWTKILREHQRARILTFINPMRDPKGEGYQVIQSKVAIGSGGIFGKGFGNGTQTNLSFLPEEHTDFIFSVLGEQFGFMGCIVVLGIYFLVIYRILHMCKDFRSRFVNLVSVGVAAIFIFHVFTNVAMTLGMMPVTGLPLPLLSYGGSFIITCMTLIGLVVNMRAYGQNW